MYIGSTLNVQMECSGLKSLNRTHGIPIPYRCHDDYISLRGKLCDANKLTFEELSSNPNTSETIGMSAAKEYSYQPSADELYEAVRAWIEDC